MTQQRSFTGRTRKRTTRKSVRIADLLARVFISACGVGTIIAVMGVCVFLVWVVIPLFQTADIKDATFIDVDWEGQKPLQVAVDEYQTMGWMLFSDGLVRAFRIDTGEVLKEVRLFQGREITCASFVTRRTEGAFGFSDGTVRLMKIGFETTYLENVDVPEKVRKELADKSILEVATFGDSIVQVTPEGQYRKQQLSCIPLEMKCKDEIVESIPVSQNPIREIDLVIRSEGPLVCVITGADSEPELKVISGEEKEDFATGGLVLTFEPPQDLPFENLSRGAPEYLEISGTGKNIYVAWADGSIIRLRCENLSKSFIAEKGRLVELGTSLTAMGFILGESTLVWGDSKGNVRAGFPIRIEEGRHDGLFNVTRDPNSHFTFAVTKTLARSGPVLRTIAASGRSRLIACGFQNGDVSVFNLTNEGMLARIEVSSEPVEACSISPKEDGFIAATGSEAFHSRFDPKHPEANMAALFLPVWYEGYSEPIHMWQSSSATDESEPKLGLVPLIFGTLKATFYAMLFGAPLALLAAIYSSEFLHPRAKAGIKPTIELMASLPSVVLGFLAAILFAPFVEKVVPATLTLFVALPFSFLLAAYVWQLFPGGFTRQWAKWKPLFVVVPLLFGILLAMNVGPLMERWLFAGDLKGWLAWTPAQQDDSGELRNSVGGWFLLWLPLSLLLVAFLNQSFLKPYMRRLASSLDRRALAGIEMIKFGLTSLLTVLVALVLAYVFDGLGIDPRGNWNFLYTDFSPLDVYVQHNALIVGFVMGFAVIPIIYTIADDALTSVPEHLRSASLGAGATPWQTAVRIIIPTAMSGLFSALMIGLGRAVGETMIVLMALGNTAIMDWNIFNGARTLSANIAVELPEAVRNSTHYRTLFLAALVLFTMTFIVNTIAEAVRLRFRKRAYQL